MNKNVYKLTSFDVDLLISSLRSKQKELEKLMENNETSASKSADENGAIDKLHHDHFDCHGLIGMLKESTDVCVAIPKFAVENFSARKHYVDFPPPYCNYNKDFKITKMNLLTLKN